MIDEQGYAFRRRQIREKQLAHEILLLDQTVERALGGISCLADSTRGGEGEAAKIPPADYGRGGDYSLITVRLR